MLLRFFVFTILVSFPFGFTVLAQNGQVPIFRAISIKDGKTKLSLGDEFSKISGLFDTTGEDFALKEPFFGGAENIIVRLGDEKKIESIFFIYDTKKSFNLAKENYYKSLGKPTGEKNLNVESIKVRVVFWEDQNTRFELVEQVERGRVLVSSALFDKK